VRYSLPQPYRDLDHTADVGVAVEGASPEEALARLVLAYAALLSGNAPVDVERDERVAVTADRGGPDLAVALLRELLFRFAVERVLPGACEVTLLTSERAEMTVGLGEPTAFSSSSTSGESVTPADARFSRRWLTDDVPGISRILGARCRSHASATCIGVAPSRAATPESVEDCSGVKPPSGKNGT